MGQGPVGQSYSTRHNPGVEPEINSLGVLLITCVKEPRISGIMVVITVLFQPLLGSLCTPLRYCDTAIRDSNYVFIPIRNSAYIPQSSLYGRNDIPAFPEPAAN